ncbi:type 2 lanthipeptide synthetase LanM family protein [Nocardiopsis baichengensis]|uniref:type 2 lanthipeptide synthetase LanM family protein n=1 Tax=Nocardiopsis baichengensis TaxID=280240 RepID=UPI00034D155D|nr:type 2 lanthipeptide synthetase LanM family protein [Nocardiopsis baichengensis]
MPPLRRSETDTALEAAAPALATLARTPDAFAAPERIAGLSLADLTWFADRIEAEEWADAILSTAPPASGPAAPAPAASRVPAASAAAPAELPQLTDVALTPETALLPWFLTLALGDRPLGDLVPAGAPEHEPLAEATRLCAEATSRAVVLHVHLRLREVEEAQCPARQAEILSGLRTPEGIAALLAEYPRLEPYCRTLAADWADARAELLDRLAADRGLLSDTFSLAPDTRVASLTGALGDRHGGGRTTHRVAFADGTVLMYKPRPAGIDQWWAELCSLLGEHGVADIRCALTLDRGEYGWQEFLANDQEADPVRYYRNLGALAAVTTLICSIDLHYENIVAVGDRPAVIDCETLLTGALMPPATEGGPEGGHPPDAAAVRDSVANLLILPGVDPGARAVEISALTGGIESASMRARRLVDDGRGPRYEMRDLDLPAHGANAPKGTRDRGAVLAYEDDFTDGYRTAYRGMLTLWRTGRLSHLLERAETVTLRYVPRPTRTYGAKLSGSTHPNVLRDPLGPDVVLSSLWTMAKTYPALARLMAHEHGDLLRGDIPYFQHTGGGRDVRAANGAVVADYFADDAVSRIRRRMERAGDADLEFQCTVIGLSFACDRARGTTASTPVNGYAAPPSRADEPAAAAAEGREPGTATPAAPLTWSAAAERRLALRLAEHVRRGVHAREGEFITFGVTTRDPLRWIMHTQGPALYDGLSGIAVALAELGAAFDLPEHRAFAAEVHASAVRQVLRYGTPSHGAHGGIAGVLWAGAVLAARHGADFGASSAQRLLDLVERAQDAPMDVVGGAAGTVLAATGALELVPGAPWAPRLRAVAGAAVGTLRARAQETGGGVHWPMADGEPSLLGFAHGSAGALYALARAGEHGLAGAPGGPGGGGGGGTDADLAAATFRWDDARRRGGVWPDLRAEEDEAAATMSAWCHGAPGIALARAAWRSVDGGAGLEAALGLMERSAPGASLNLCHGLLGNAQVAERLRRRGAASDGQAREARDRVHRLVSGLGGPDALLLGPRPEFETGMAPSAPLPGLMTGLGGFAHWLAAVRDPSVPDVLTLEA